MRKFLRILNNKLLKVKNNMANLDENVISFTFQNWITVVAMALLAFVVFSVITIIVNKIKQGKTQNENS
jgi:hypothetical protein